MGQKTQGWKIVREGALSLAELCFPRECAGCGAKGSLVCEACRAAVLRRPVVFSGTRVGWGPEQQIAALGPYRPPWRGLALAGKNSPEREVRACLIAAGMVLGRELPFEFAAVVPVPSHRRPGRAELETSSGCLATGVALGAGVPLCPVLRLHAGASKQAGRDVCERFRARAGAFFAPRSPHLAALARSRGVLLVDDVITSGASVFLAGRALEARGVRVTGAAALCLVVAD